MDQTQLPAHSEAKIKLLSEYLEAYLSIISRDRKTRHIQLADVFCGPGNYKDKIGSPVAIARMLAAMYKQNPSAPKASFLANDRRRINVGKVEELIRPIDRAHPRLNITTSQKDAKEILETLKKQKLERNEKRFLFIDPFGYKDVLLEDILSMLHGNQTELLLFQPSSFMFRFSEKGTPPKLEGILSSLSDGQPWPNGLDLIGYIKHTKALLEKRVGDSFFVDTFTIQKDPQTIFCLFFFTPHIRGFEKMLEAKWKMDEMAGAGWHFSETMGESLFEKPDPQVLSLEKALQEKLNTGPLTNADLYLLTLRNGFLPKHMRDILNSFQKARKIEVQPKTTRKGAFYINYENFRDNPRKIEISKINKTYG